MLDRMGVRARIITGALLIVSVVLAALGVVLWRAMATALSTTAHESVVGAVAEIAGDLKDGSLEAALRLDDQPNPLRVRQVLDDQGNVLAWSRASVRGGALADVAELPEVDQIVTEPRSNLPRLGKGAVIVGSTRVVAEDGRTLTVLASEPATISNAAATKLGLVMLAIGLAALAVLAVVLTYAVRSALDPVVRMSEDLESINSSREDRGVEVPRRDDEISRLGRTINGLLGRLRRADEERAAFVSNAGHELRSPLTTVGVSLELLSSELSPERREVVSERASGELQRLRDLVEDLLALAKADEHATLVGAEQVDLDDVVLGEVAVARSKGAEVQVYLTPVQVYGVTDQIRRVIRNLVDNGMRHADSQLRIEVRQDGDLAVLNIDNDGNPVPAEDRERIFDRFIRLDDARDRDMGGSGLGLAIVRELVRLHGGSVETLEAEDGWCRFEVRLPTTIDQVEGSEFPLVSV
jgi:signal transduction histidine kinase